jgi:hypothetical protein
VGSGRTTRRALARGGTGAARALNVALSGWDGVRITPMFGRWGYFVGDHLFACFPLRDKDRDLWVRLSLEDQARALREPGVRPHRRFARRGWIELQIEGEGDVARWAGCAGRALPPRGATVPGRRRRERPDPRLRGGVLVGRGAAGPVLETARPHGGTGARRDLPSHLRRLPFRPLATARLRRRLFLTRRRRP